MSLEGLEADPHILLQDFIAANYPDDGSVDPKQSEIIFGQFPNTQGEIFIVTQDLMTYPFDNLDLGQYVSDNRASVDVHLFIKSFTILTDAALYPPESDPTRFQNMVSFIEQFIDDNETGLEDKKIRTIQRSPTIWLDRHSWQDDIFHAIVRVTLNYFE